MGLMGAKREIPAYRVTRKCLNRTKGRSRMSHSQKSLRTTHSTRSRRQQGWVHAAQTVARHAVLKLAWSGILMIVLSVSTTSASPQSSTPSNQSLSGDTPRYTVVVIDAATNIEPTSKRPYVDLITELVSTIPGIRAFREPLTADWNREDAVVALNPVLIIMHINGFSLVVTDGRAYTRYTSLIKRFRDRNTHFLLYSRSTSFNSSKVAQYVKQQSSKDSGLPMSRFSTFALNRQQGRSDFDVGGEFPDNLMSSDLRVSIELILKRRQ